jgi:thymidylate synthase (FAD)
MHSKARYNSDVTVELVKHSASDHDVAFAARVSTQGERSLESVSGFDMGENEKLFGLINFLARERHGSPLEHSVFTFYVKAPIFVWREHMRHHMASYNEESGRYRQLEPEFYIPSIDRKLIQTGKTGAYVFESGQTSSTPSPFKHLGTVAKSPIGTTSLSYLRESLVKLLEGCCQSLSIHLPM